MLFLIDDDQTEVAELHVLRGESLRADHDFQSSALQPFLRLPGFGSRTGSRQASHFDTERDKPFAESRDVLSCQDSRRYRNCHLPSCQHDSRRRSQGHLGLAEPDVAADDPVHGVAGREIIQDVPNGLRLVDRREKRKACDEPLIDGARGYEFRSPAATSLANMFGELLTGDLNLTLCLGTPSPPCTSVRL